VFAQDPAVRGVDVVTTDNGNKTTSTDQISRRSSFSSSSTPVTVPFVRPVAARTACSGL
jgi:hypothetical protein